MGKKIITRRDFLRMAAATPLAGMFTSGFGPYYHTKPGQVRVVLVRDKHALKSFKNPDPQVIQKMIDSAVTALLDIKDPVAAWKTLVKPSDIVGIKSNVWYYLPTPGEVENAIRRRVIEAGVPEENIGIDDRGVRRNPVFQKATVLINARPARSHHWSGMGSCIKNYIMFTPRASAWHGDSCADLAQIWKEYSLKEKTKLNILVMLTPLFHGVGPHHYSRKYVWGYKGLVVGKDPVAVDSTGMRILQAKRKEYFGEERPLQPPPKHIFLADKRHNLGESDPQNIDLIKLGWKEGILI